MTKAIILKGTPECEGGPAMVKRKDDNSLPPSGGRAAERLRQFEDARRLQEPAPVPEAEQHDQSESDQRAGEARTVPHREANSAPKEDGYS
jgi:hypothetical protein